ncbi:hypothetical protein AAAK29_09950 [Mesorhizobium sp. CCNWLW179-1]|uniref:hypothetical protein n=1 Tax=Mesorhizobium sp. CCNWLW176 TaxID=3125802 RepID=UPI003014A002
MLRGTDDFASRTHVRRNPEGTRNANRALTPVEHGNKIIGNAPDTSKKRLPQSPAEKEPVRTNALNAEWFRRGGNFLLVQKDKPDGKFRNWMEVTAL